MQDDVQEDNAEDDSEDRENIIDRVIVIDDEPAHHD